MTPLQAIEAATANGPLTLGPILFGISKGAEWDGGGSVV
jgi:hypothetical protein